MARQYPRFLYANPLNTKSKGHFIVHTISPKVLMKVHIIDDQYDHYKKTRPYPLIFSECAGYALERVEEWDVPIANDVMHRLFSDAHDWLQAQIDSGFIRID